MTQMLYVLREEMIMPHTHEVRLLLRLAERPHKAVIIGYDIVSFRIEALLNSATETARKNVNSLKSKYNNFAMLKVRFY